MNSAQMTDTNVVLKPERRVRAISLVGSAKLSKLGAWIDNNSGWLAIGLILAAFAIRTAYASSCYLNPDEAQHFNAARPNSWVGAYKAACLLAHPPLLIMLLHAILFLGRTELILRLPSLVGGTVALWLTFAWIRRTLGAIPALAGLLFMAISASAISASTEVRQYGLLLCFVCGALYATQRVVSESSTRYAIVQGLFLVGAVLTHYTAPVVIIALDIYVLLCWLFDEVPRRILFTIIANQIVVAAVFGWIYFAQFHHAGVSNVTGLAYVRQAYWVSGTETLLGFSKRAFFGTFSYMVNRRLAFLSMLVFLAGFAALLSGRTKAPRVTALLIISPLLLGFVTALCQLLPFAGSRHQTYLLPFLALGFSAAITWMPRTWMAPLLLVGVVLAPHWLTQNPPDNNPRIFPIRDMTAATNYIQQAVPYGSPLFVDEQTRYLLGYYLGRNDSSLDWQRPLRSNERIDGRRIVAPRGYVWSFNPKETLSQLNDSAGTLGLATTEPLWVVSVAWQEPPLATRLPAEGRRSLGEFGKIGVFNIDRAVAGSK